MFADTAPLRRFLGGAGRKRFSAEGECALFLRHLLWDCSVVAAGFAPLLRAELRAGRRQRLGEAGGRGAGRGSRCR